MKTVGCMMLLALAAMLLGTAVVFGGLSLLYYVMVLCIVYPDIAEALAALLVLLVSLWIFRAIYHAAHPHKRYVLQGYTRRT